MLFRKSLDSIVSNFNKAVKQLDALHARNVRKAAKHRSAAATHASNSAALESQNARVRNVRGRLADLVA
jgi:hypothetical protein